MWNCRRQLIVYCALNSKLLPVSLLVVIWRLLLEAFDEFCLAGDGEMSEERLINSYDAGSLAASWLGRVAVSGS